MFRIRRAIDTLKFVPGMRAVANLPVIRPVKDRIGAAIDTFDIKRLPDRKYFLETIVPNVAALGVRRLLFVGCRAYCVSYCRLWQQSGLDCWTIDIDPVAAQWGLPGRHIVGDVLEIDRLFPPAHFDAVVMNGVFGFGIETESQIQRSLCVIADVMQSSGLFLVGWNTDKTIDTAALPVMNERFEYNDRIGFPRRKTFPASTHVYDFYVKRA